MVKKQSINRIIIVVSIIFLVLLFGYLFGYKQGSFYKFFLSKNKALTTEGFYNDDRVFIDYKPVNTYLVANFETILEHVINKNVTALAAINTNNNNILSTFDTKSLPLFIKSIFDNNNFLMLVDFKNEDGSISIESPIESYEKLCMQQNPEAKPPVTKFLSDKFAELIVFIRDALTKKFLDPNLPIFTNYLSGNTNKVEINDLYSKYHLYSNLANEYSDIIIFLYKYNDLSQEAIGDYIFKDIFIDLYRFICYSSKPIPAPQPTKEDDPTTTMPNNIINLSYRLTNVSISYIKTIIFNAILFQQYQIDRSRQLAFGTGGTGGSDASAAGGADSGTGGSDASAAGGTGGSDASAAGGADSGTGDGTAATAASAAGGSGAGGGTTTTIAGTTTTTQQDTTPTAIAGLETETEEFQREVLNRLSELYNDNSELSDELKEAVKNLPLNIRNNICRDYCSVSTTNNANFCNDIGCSGMSGLSNDALGLMDSLTNDRSPDYATVNDAYSLLDVDNGTMSKYLSTGMYRHMFNDGNMQSMGIPDSRRIQPKSKFAQTNIIQKDTDGVSNIFAPNIYVLPKRDGSYATYMANDPNDPAYRDFINNLITNYA